MPNIISNKELDDGYINYYLNMFDQYELYNLDFIKENPNYKFYIFIEDSYMFIKMVDIKYLNNIKLIAFAALELLTINNRVGYQIKITKSFISKQGLMSDLFKFILFELDETIFSDDTHTLPGSMNFWKSLRSWGNSQVEILNKINNQSSIYTTQEDHLIWGLDQIEYKITNGWVNVNLINQWYIDKWINRSIFDFCINNNGQLFDRSSIVLSLSKL